MTNVDDVDFDDAVDDDDTDDLVALNEKISSSVVDVDEIDDVVAVDDAADDDDSRSLWTWASSSSSND